MKEQNPNARFKLVESPVLSPGEDFITRTIRGPFIDTNTDLGFGQKGRVYLSVETLREMADVAGLLDTAASTEVREKEAYAQGYADAMKEKLDVRFLDAFDELVDVFRADTRPDRVLLVEEREDSAVSVETAAEAASPPVEEPAGGAAPIEPVLDGVVDSVLDAGDDSAEPNPAPRGKGDGSGSKRRRDDVPSDSSDGANPFKL